MTKILFVTSKSLGGSGKYISTLVKFLGQHGFDCDLIYFPIGAQQDKEIEKDFNKIFYFKKRPGFSPLGVYCNIKQLSSIIKRERYDIVHTHTSLGGAIGRIAAAFGDRKVKVAHTLHAFGADEFTPYPQKYIYKIIEKFLDHLTDGYISPSGYMLQYGRENNILDFEKVSVVYNGLELKPPLATRELVRSDLRQRLGLTRDVNVGLFCGRLEPQKAVDVLLRAIAIVDSSVPIHLVVCGKGELEKELGDLAKSLKIDNKVSWMGWQSELDQFYAAADFFIMPSRWESFGLVFLEAMNYSLPILSTRTQAIPEVVADGESGLLSPVDDAHSLASNIERIGTNEQYRIALGDEGNKRLHKKFTLEQFIAGHVDFYQSLLVEKNSLV